jgi:hypothetical protein
MARCYIGTSGWHYDDNPLFVGVIILQRQSRYFSVM